jgi:hypothetical protein
MAEFVYFSLYKHFDLVSSRKIILTKINMTGISSLFPAFPKQMSILDRVNITVARHKNDYFKNWTSQQFDDIDNITRLVELIAPDDNSCRKSFSQFGAFSDVALLMQ